MTVGRNIVLLIHNGSVLVFSTTKMLNKHNNFLSEVSHTIKIQNFDHQNWSDCFV